MVKDLEGPVQLTPLLVKVGVTIIVAIIGVVPILMAEKAAISPLPEAASPIPGSLLIHE
jgi:hypothetical protein